MRAREACATAMMTAACLAVSYALVGVPNVTLMDFLVFASGLLFGSRVGVSVAVLTWAIYGTLNPYGFCLPVFIATSASETIYGLAGGLLRRSWGPFWPEREKLAWSAYRLGVLGFCLTALYDLLTNIAYAYAFGVPLPIALACGAYFALLHELTNAFFFATCTPALARVARLLGPERAWPSAREGGDQEWRHVSGPGCA